MCNDEWSLDGVYHILNSVNLKTTLFQLHDEVTIGILYIDASHCPLPGELLVGV